MSSTPFLDRIAPEVLGLDDVSPRAPPRHPDAATPRTGTRAYNHERAVGAFPPDAEAQFNAFLADLPGRRRKTDAEVRDGIQWFVNDKRPCNTAAEQNARHWWKSGFRYCPIQDCLFAKPTAKHALERRVVTEENYFATILYEHDINGPRGHETTTKALLQRYYGPTRQEALDILKKCISCTRRAPDTYPSPPDALGAGTTSNLDPTPGTYTSNHALRQISHGPRPLPGIPIFDNPNQQRQWQLRHMAAAFRYFSRHGYVEGMSGHISVRDPEHPDAFWINPLGRHFGLLKASDMMLIDMTTGDVVGGNTSRPANAAGFHIHRAVHLARPDVHAVCHAHTIHGRAYSCLARPLEMLTQDVCNFYNAHSVYENYNGIALGEQEGVEIAEALGAGKACILMNHGLLTVGGTVDEAAFLFGLMERSCQIQLLADAAENAGRPKRLIADAEAEYNFKAASDPQALYAEFQPDYEYEEAMCNGDIAN